MLLAMTLTAMLAVPAVSNGTCNEQKDIVDTAVAAGSFKTLVTAVKAAGLVDVLKGDGPFTVFAPSDEAFAKVPRETLNALLADKKALTKVLTYHVVAGRVPARKVVASEWLDTVEGQALRVQANEDGVQVDGARVVKADIEASNGIIHVIDQVLLPRKDIVDTAVEAGSFNTLVAALQTADLVETLKAKGPYTVFAPTDAAFGKLPEGTIPALLKDKPKLTSILTYHVVPGRIMSSALKSDAATVKPVTAKLKTVQGGEITIVKAKDGTITVNGARVVTRDLVVGNGVIHVIDAVILPN